MKRWTLVLTIAFLGILLLGVTAVAQEGGDSVAAPLAQPQIRVAHLAPFAADPGTAVTVTLDSTPVLTDFVYGDSTEYVMVTPPGEYLVEIFPGASTTAAISGTVNLMGETEYTASRKKEPRKMKSPGEGIPRGLLFGQVAI